MREKRQKYHHRLLSAGLLIVVLSALFGQTAQAEQRHSDTFDDVLQYVPYATTLTLKACGVQSRDGWWPLLATMGGSWVMTAGSVWTLKHTVNEWRPDDSDQRSFPSGHAAIAFAGATMLRHEFGHVSPWITAAGYGVATFTAVDRVIRRRHHWYDAVAGAAIGVGAGELSWWLSRKVFKTDAVAITFTGTSLGVSLTL